MPSWLKEPHREHSNIRHPELMVTLIIQGLAELIGNGLRERSVILDLIEQGLNLPENSLQ